ncbi:MAG: DUF192 domain-containing protein [Nitrososphaerales archaeon]|jgi:uncharacterized membrane protein (UPF0127 family)
MSFLRNPRDLIAIGVLALLLAIAAYATLGMSGSVTSPVPTEFTVDGRTYAFTYIATNNAQRAAGLMNRQVTNTTTMLFAFPAMGNYQFWMYDTNTSLDMIWINATGNTGRVVYVYADAQPCSLSCPNYPTSSSVDYKANYVIEAKAGFAAANGIEVGTQIQFG